MQNYNDDEAEAPVRVESHPLHESDVLGVLVVAVTSHLLGLKPASLLACNAKPGNTEHCKTINSNATQFTVFDLSR